MEINRVSTYRHRKPHSSRHLHNLLTATTTTAVDTGEDLSEADLFSDSPEFTHSHSPTPRRLNNRNKTLGFSSGILAALSDETATTMTPVRSIPKPPPLQQQQQRVSNEWTQSVPSRNFHQHSAPMNVPMMMKNARKFGQLDEFLNGDDDDDDEEMLPPHEIVAMKVKSTSSVLEGVGRTLKGRDLRQVRNAVWRQTGFLD